MALGKREAKAIRARISELNRTLVKAGREQDKIRMKLIPLSQRFAELSKFRENLFNQIDYQKAQLEGREHSPRDFYAELAEINKDAP
jgi:uncharacterized coiled-coil DUF342 family protein